MTDANVQLGRVLPDVFPKIFGKDQNEPLDHTATNAAMQATADTINADRPADAPMSADDVAYGFIQVANEAMCRPIRALTQMRGYDVTQHVLATFGGAGPQHACAIARSLGIKTVFIHKYASVLSAYGISMADVVEEASEPCALPCAPCPATSAPGLHPSLKLPRAWPLGTLLAGPRPSALHLQLGTRNCA